MSAATTLPLACHLWVVKHVELYGFVLSASVRLVGSNVQHAVNGGAVRSLARKRPSALGRNCGFLQRDHYPGNHHR